MATIVGSQVKLSSGKLVTPQQGGWYDGQQYWGGTLSAPGVINSQSNQQGAGQAVSNEVIAQTNPNNVAYIQQQQQSYKPTANTQPLPSSTTQNNPSFSSAAVTGQATTPIASTQETINLPKLYEQLYASSGVRDLEAKYSQMEQDFINAKNIVNNNPWLAEGNRTGRQAKLETLFNDRTSNIKNEIAMKKADIETQLNLQTKQFDINSQQTQQAWNQFNTLLEMGALDNASGEDIANLTRSTGIPTNLISQAIVSAKKSKVGDRKTQVVQSTNDAGMVTVSVIDTQTGEIVRQQSLGKIGNAQNGTATDKKTQLQQRVATAIQSVANEYGHITPDDWKGALNSWVANGGRAEDFVAQFSQYKSPHETYVSVYGEKKAEDDLGL